MQAVCQLIILNFLIGNHQTLVHEWQRDLLFFPWPLTSQSQPSSPKLTDFAFRPDLLLLVWMLRNLPLVGWLDLCVHTIYYFSSGRESQKIHDPKTSWTSFENHSNQHPETHLLNHQNDFRGLGVPSRKLPTIPPQGWANKSLGLGCCVIGRPKKNPQKKTPKGPGIGFLAAIGCGNFLLEPGEIR